MMNNKLARSKQINGKKVIFLVRHENDLDFMLPLMLQASNPVVLFWDHWYVFDSEKDFRIRLLKRHNIEPVSLSHVKKSIVVRVFLKLLRLINSKVYGKYYSYLDNKYKSAMFCFFENYLQKMHPDKVNCIVFDHTVNATVRSMVSIIKQWSNEIQVLSLPHGQGIVTNKLTKYKQIKPDKGADWSIFDQIVCFNKNKCTNGFDNVPDDKKMVIPSLRNTVEWADVLLDELLDKRDKDTQRNQLTFSRNGIEKVKFLIIHTRLSSNINFDEVVRCVRILDVAQAFDVRIKPHPRRISDAIQLAGNLKSVSLIQKHILECIYWADCVLFFQSSAVYDALLLNKPVLYPNYISSNQVEDRVLTHCNVMNTPDDFYNIVNSISAGEEIMSPNYSPSEWESLVEKWGAVLNG